MGDKDKSVEAQQEILNHTIDGKPDSPAVQVLMSDEFLKMSDVDAAQVGKALREIVRGEMDDKMEIMFHKFLEYVDKRDKERDKFEEDRLKWFQQKIDEANKLKVSGSAKDTLDAKSAEMAKRVREKVTAESATAILEFKKKVSDAPKILYASSGKPMRTRRGIRYEPEVYKRVVGNRSFSWVFPINKPVMVPDFILKELLARKEKETDFERLDTQLKKMDQWEEAVKIDSAIDPMKADDAINLGQSFMEKGE
jgi:hypothetical protein